MKHPCGASLCTWPFPGLGLTYGLGPQGPRASADSHLLRKVSQASARPGQDTQQSRFKTNPPPPLPPDCFMRKHCLAVATGSAASFPRRSFGERFLLPLSSLFLWILTDLHLLMPRLAAATERRCCLPWRLAEARAPGSGWKWEVGPPCLPPSPVSPPPLTSLSYSLSLRFKRTK